MSYSKYLCMSQLYDVISYYIISFYFILCCFILLNLCLYIYTYIYVYNKDIDIHVAIRIIFPCIWECSPILCSCLLIFPVSELTASFISSAEKIQFIHFIQFHRLEHMTETQKQDWSVVSTLLKNISQLGLLFPIYIYIYGRIKNVPNHQPEEIALNSSIQMLHHDELPPAPAAHVGCWGWHPRRWDTSAPHLPPALGTLRLRARGSLSGRNKLSWGQCSGADLHHLSCIKPSQLRGGRSQSKSCLMNLAELLRPTSSTNASKYQSTCWWEQRIQKTQAGKIGNITKLEASLKVYHKKRCVWGGRQGRLGKLSLVLTWASHPSASLHWFLRRTCPKSPVNGSAAARRAELCARAPGKNSQSSSVVPRRKWEMLVTSLFCKKRMGKTYLCSMATLWGARPGYPDCLSKRVPLLFHHHGDGSCWSYILQ